MPATDGIENEIKLRVADADAVRVSLGRVGAILAVPRHFEDNLLLDDGVGSLLASGSVLRVRRAGEGGTLTFKGTKRVVDGIKSREEIEVPLGDPDAALRVMAALGYRPVFRYQKYREAYRWEGVEIVLDETPIGTFLEIEGESAVIPVAAAALGYRPPDFIADSYAALFRAGGGSGDMVFSPS